MTPKVKHYKAKARRYKAQAGWDLSKFSKGDQGREPSVAFSRGPLDGVGVQIEISHGSPWRTPYADNPDPLWLFGAYGESKPTPLAF